MIAFKYLFTIRRLSVKILSEIDVGFYQSLKVYIESFNGLICEITLNTAIILIERDSDLVNGKYWNETS